MADTPNYKQIKDFDELNKNILNDDDMLLIQDHNGITKHIKASVLNDIKRNMLFYEVLDDNDNIE